MLWFWTIGLWIHIVFLTKILMLDQIFCAIPKTDLQIVPVPNFLCQTIRWFSYSKFSFCAGTKLFGAVSKFNSIFGLAQNIWTGTKHFGSCRRTRQPLYRESKEEEKNHFTRRYKKGQENTDKCRHVYQYDISSITFRRKKR